MAVTLRQLEVFVAVARHGNVTRAAAEVFLSQSAASMALAEMEKQLGGNLFDRQGKRLLVNERGRALLPRAQEVLARVQEIEELFGTGAGAAGRRPQDRRQLDDRQLPDSADLRRFRPRPSRDPAHARCRQYRTGRPRGEALSRRPRLHRGVLSRSGDRDHPLAAGPAGGLRLAPPPPGPAERSHPRRSGRRQLDFARAGIGNPRSLRNGHRRQDSGAPTSSSNSGTPKPSSRRWRRGSASAASPVSPSPAPSSSASSSRCRPPFSTWSVASRSCCTRKSTAPRCCGPSSPSAATGSSRADNADNSPLRQTPLFPSTCLPFESC